MDFTCKSIDFPDYLKPIIEIQDVADDISTENYEESIEKLDSVLQKTKKIKGFIKISLSVLTGRSIPSIPLVDTIIHFAKKYKNETVPIILETKNWYIIKQLFLNGVIDKEPEEMTAQNPNSFFHGPVHIMTSEPDTEIEREIRRIDMNIPMETLLADNRKVLNEVYKYLYPKSSPFYIIQNDDVDALQKLQGNVGFSLEMNERSLSIEWKSSQIIDLTRHAMRCGAVKCFKFLILNGCKYDDPSFAFIGGNIEIIRLCTQSDKINTANYFHLSVRAHRNEIVDWIFANNDHESLSHNIQGFNNNIRAYIMLMNNWHTSIYEQQLLIDDISDVLRYSMENFDNSLITSNIINNAILCRASNCFKLLSKELGIKPERNNLDAIASTPYDKEFFKSIEEFVIGNNETNQNGQTILNSAILVNNYELAKALLETGKCDVTIPDAFDRTPLHNALTSNDIDFDIIKLLIEQGADPNSADKNGETPLFYAIRNCCGLEIIEYLASKGAKLDVVNTNGLNLLNMITRDNVEIAKFLVENGADVNNKDNIGTTPLMSAAQNDLTNIVKYLIEQGADPHEKNNFGRTCKDCAYSRELTEYLQSLE